MVVVAAVVVVVVVIRAAVVVGAGVLLLLFWVFLSLLFGVGSLVLALSEVCGLLLPVCEAGKQARMQKNYKRYPDRKAENWGSYDRIRSSWVAWKIYYPHFNSNFGLWSNSLLSFRQVMRLTQCYIGNCCSPFIVRIIVIPSVLLLLVLVIETYFINKSWCYRCPVPLHPC